VIELLQVSSPESGVALAAIAFAGAVVTASFAFVWRFVEKFGELKDVMSRNTVAIESMIGLVKAVLTERRP
jgi:uncharacterized membrane protein YjfL (UPF0719 family)